MRGKGIGIIRSVANTGSHHCFCVDPTVLSVTGLFLVRALGAGYS